MAYTSEVTAQVIGQNIALLCTWRGLKRYELAEKVGDAPQRVSQVVSGKFPPQLSTLNKYARALDVEVRELLDPQLKTSINLSSAVALTDSEVAA